LPQGGDLREAGGGEKTIEKEVYPGQNPSGPYRGGKPRRRECFWVFHERKSSGHDKAGSKNTNYKKKEQRSSIQTFPVQHRKASTTPQKGVSKNRKANVKGF